MAEYTAPKKCWAIIFDVDVLAEIVALEENETITTGLSKMEIYYFEDQANKRLSELNPFWKNNFEVPSDSTEEVTATDVPKPDLLEPPEVPFPFSVEMEPPTPSPDILTF